MRSIAARRVCWREGFFSSRRGHTRFGCDWSSGVCSSDLAALQAGSPDEPNGGDPMNKHVADLAAPKVTTGPLPASRKIYATPHGAPDLRVPLREIGLSEDRKSAGWGKGEDLGGRRSVKKK